MRAPFGMATPKLVVVKEQPMPKIRSARSRKCRTVFGIASPPEPSASGCVSSKALLPSSEVQTGIASSSASRRSSSQASAQWTPCPA